MAISEKMKFLEVYFKINFYLSLQLPSFQTVVVSNGAYVPTKGSGDSAYTAAIECVRIFIFIYI